MSDPHPPLPLVYLARHGETAWSITGQHTGLTDLLLTQEGERNARRLGQRLRRLNFDHVFTSPLQRARQTCELAGFGDQAQFDGDLVEWDYGEYDGKTSQQIKLMWPEWELFRDGCPGGESLAEITLRVDRIIARLRPLKGHTLLFSHGHLLRVLGARWLNLPAAVGRSLYLSTAAFSMLGYVHSRDNPVLRLWNDCGHAHEIINPAAIQ